MSVVLGMEAAEHKELLLHYPGRYLSTPLLASEMAILLSLVLSQFGSLISTALNAAVILEIVRLAKLRR